MKYSEQRINFWTELWQDLIKNFLKKSAFGLNLYSPHILVEDIIVEIEENHFQNLDNKKFLYNRLNFFIDNDQVIKKEMRSKFNIVRKNFEPPKFNYLLEALNDIRNNFESGFYFDKSLILLVDSLILEEEITNDFIKSCKYLSEVLIIEFIKRNYSLDDIKKFAEYIFDEYEYENSDKIRVFTNFPHGIDYENYWIAEDEVDPKFYAEVRDLMDTLTSRERLLSLSNLYYKKTEKVYYIFIVEGLKGDTVVEIGGVTFYSLNSKRFTNMPDNPTEDYENLQQDREEIDRFLQAAVEVDYLKPRSSLKQAINKMENSLDLISCYYNNNTALEIDISNYVIVKDNSWKYFGSGTDKRQVFSKHLEALDLTTVKIFDELIDKGILWVENSNNKAVWKIKNALHWYRKAQESRKDEDKLLNFWISIENLFFEKEILSDVLKKNKNSKFHIIQEIIASNQIFAFIYNYGWDLYRHYNNQVNHAFYKPKLSLPNELIQKAQLNKKKGEKIYLEEFINSLEEIKIYEINPFFLEEIEKTLKFYKDIKTTKKIIQEQIEQIQNDILMIYRLRNLVVHNAHFDNSLLEYHVWKIEQFSGNFLRSVIRNLEEDRSLSDIILKIHFKREHFENEIEIGKFDIFNK
ncbi:HEPN domain-containing protein [Flavobacterium sp. ov086]|uniref:HEPN domain-containing protein n=1 Tax=Flavobacterium sp. ov086 TaxID=1761785 RepID=UPI000B71EED1|nr:HEPN domain-containing protein [Flavobacterium sp. ov086]SNR37774.1 hypothetical protein SAMN04487979_104169 [Flavobacterium sp. ov086]